jgi:hypothetical protein
MLARLRQRDRRALASRPAGAPDSMHVRLGVGRKVVVDHVRDVLDVETSRRDVGGDQQVGLGRTDTVHHRVALALLHAAVQRLGAVAVRVEDLDQRVDFEPRAAEHDGRGRTLHVQDAVERRGLLAGADDVGDLANSGKLALPPSSPARRSPAPAP